MDENRDNTTPQEAPLSTPTTPPLVDDVRSPERPIVVTSSEESTSSEPVVSQDETQEPLAVEPGEPTNEPQQQVQASSEDVFTAQPEPQPDSSTLAAPTEPAAEPAPVSAAPTLVHKPASHKSAIVVLLTIVVALLLIAAAVLFYLRDQNKISSTGSATQTSTAATETTTQAPATGTDVQAVSGEIDSTMNTLNDASDYSASSVSDATLGL